MNLLKQTADLERELLAERHKQIGETQLLAEVSGILRANDAAREEIHLRMISGEAAHANSLDLGLLETDRIFHVSQIQKICIAYRLRFLSSKYFKGGIPEEAITAARTLEAAHRTQLSGFHVVAPSKTFRLKDFNDPLLFAPIGNGYFYLVHKWGNDLSAWRKVLVWPFRNLLTFTLVAVALSFFAAWLTPETKLSKSVPLADVIVFLFAFKSIFAIAMYSFFTLGKKFNSSIWDSEYFN